MNDLTDRHEHLRDCDCHACALASRDYYRSALVRCARHAEELKRPCGDDPESAQAVRNSEYQYIATMAHVALGTVRGPDPGFPLTRSQAKAIMRMARELEDTGRLASLARGGCATDQEASDWRAKNRNVQCALQDYLDSLAGA